MVSVIEILKPEMPINCICVENDGANFELIGIRVLKNFMT